MADGGPDERQCIGSINRALKRYGSTCNHVKRPPSDGCVRAVIRHELEEGDTLQGLALKYSTTMEEIRRANRLWASDSVFARETLLIPVETAATGAVTSTTLGAGAFSSADSGNSSDSSTAEEGPSAIMRESRPHRPHVSVPTDQSDSSPSEFLCKIDSAIARTKHQVNKINSNSQFSSMEEEEIGQRRRRPCVSRLRAGATGPDLGDRRLKSSLQKLEQSQDAIFEL